MNDTDMVVVSITAQAMRNSIPLSGTLEDRLRFAFSEIRSRPRDFAWMCHNDDQMFRGAVGAVMLSASDEERARIEADLHNLRILSAMLSGIPVDTEAITVPENPLGLMGMWHASAERAK